MNLDSIGMPAFSASRTSFNDATISRPLAVVRVAFSRITAFLFVFRFFMGGDVAPWYMPTEGRQAG